MYDRNAHKVDLAAQRRDSLSRRRFLRGAGICLALPAFESLLPGRLLAAVTEAGGKPGALATTATGAPLRTGFVYFPNGAIQKSWWPNGNGGDFTLNTTLQPLEPLRKFVRVLGGLDHACAVGEVDGGGEVVSMTAFGDNAGEPNATDSIDKLSARPDFIVEIYPGGAGIPQTLPADAPTAFLLVANDDDHTDSVLKIFRLYRAARLPVEVHVFTRGQHAFNMGTRSKLTTIKNWPQRLADWMGDNNLLDPATPAANVR